MNRREFLAASGLAFGGLVGLGGRAGAALAQAGGGWGDGEYWAFIDRLQARMDARWIASTTQYWPSQSMVQANMLLVHAAAAQAGHRGGARQDERARILVGRLCSAPYFAERGAPPGDQFHEPGWIDGGIQHLVVDEQVVSGLAAAWQARAALGLDDATAGLIADRVVRTALTGYWRWPTLRLNQIGWYCRLYVAAVQVGGPPALLDDLLFQVRRFLDEATRRGPGRSVPNLGPGYRFHYLPNWPAGHSFNLDSPEYACATLGYMGAYQEARALGMKALDARRAQVARAWAERALCGYWTHAGYLNWDTGLGFKRWHQGKKLALAQQGLLGIAACPELRPDDGHGAWAKHLLDAGFGFYDRQLALTAELPPANFFSVPSEGENPYSQSLTASRFAANAAKAVLLGLGRAPSRRPPPLYAYDPDVGRLAVTTQYYSTAVVPCARKAFPYGGMDVARLVDGLGEPAANVGGGPPASFGLVVRDAGNRVLLVSQRPVLQRRGVKPFSLTRAPRGTARELPAYPRRPYAGPFTDLRGTGTVRRRNLRITVAHRFTERWIETRWTMRKTGGKARLSTEAWLPSTGATTLTAVLRDGSRRALAPGARLRLASVRWFHVQSQRAGYVAVPRSAPGGAIVTVLSVSRQAAAPVPGPSVRIELARRSRRATQTLVLRYAPVADAAAADALANTLIAR